MEKLIRWLSPRLSSMIQSGWRSSAMKPLLSVGVISFFAMLFMPDTVLIMGVPIKGVLGIAFCVYLFFVIRAYFKILDKDPKLLQSEHYQLSMRQMDLESQRLGFPPVLTENDDVSAVPLKTNRQIPNPVGENNIVVGQIAVSEGGRA